MPASTPHITSVALMKEKASVSDLAFRDPNHFVAGEVHKHVNRWEEILDMDIPKHAEILSYIHNKVKLQDFIVPFKGDFQGEFYDCPSPPRMTFPNSTSCLEFQDFITDTISQRLRNGSISAWGRVGEVDPPHLVMPLTMEPSKPRLCHDERFLNLWIVDLPLKLDYISNLPRYIGKGHFQVTMDDKSGYDHVLLSEECRRFFGFCWRGWYFVYNTIPFGWKASAYIYHTIGMGATNYMRSLGVPCSQYIDDRHVGQLVAPSESQVTASSFSNLDRSKSACFICASTLISLGYFIGLSKCVLQPSQVVKFLGFLVDSELQAFMLPQEKISKFATLREEILSKRSVCLKTMQRWSGKVASFSMAVPAARLYAREVYQACSGRIRSRRDIRVSGDLRKEIEHWRFLDSWEGCLPWAPERHSIVKMFSDASELAWGGVFDYGNKALCTVRDYWTGHDRDLPIVIKEAKAVLKLLQAGKSFICNSRVDIHSDSMAFIQSWQRQGGKCKRLNDVLKEMNELILSQNVVLNFQYIPSAENPADAPSRELSDKDCTLAEAAWEKVQQSFGPHSIDAMALDSNCQRDTEGRPLRHFTPYYTPLSSGVNFFAQDIHCSENVYIFPPFILVGPVLILMLEARVPFTIVVPRLYPLPFWWPILKSASQARIVVGKKGDSNVLLFPSKKEGYVARPLQWDLLAFRIDF